MAKHSQKVMISLKMNLPTILNQTHQTLPFKFQILLQTRNQIIQLLIQALLQAQQLMKKKTLMMILMDRNLIRRTKNALLAHSFVTFQAIQLTQCIMPSSSQLVFASYFYFCNVFSRNVAASRSLNPQKYQTQMIRTHMQLSKSFNLIKIPEEKWRILEHTKIIVQQLGDQVTL